MGMAIKPRLMSERKPIIVQAEMIRRSCERVLKDWRFSYSKMLHKRMLDLGGEGQVVAVDLRKTRLDISRESVVPGQKHVKLGQARRRGHEMETFVDAG